MAITSLSTSSLVSGVKRRRVWDQTATTDGFFQIATTTLNVAASSITFSSIPQDYTHLQIRHIARNSGANADLNIAARFNGDSGSNYSEHYLYGTGSAAASGGNASTNAILFGRMTGANSTSGIFGVSVNDILDYSNTNKFKTHRCFCGHDQNGSGFLFMFSGNWRSTAAITSVTIYPGDFATTFTAGSSFALYGIKG
jgi:hypothetical protein